jgi:hypothetical protein
MKGHKTGGRIKGTPNKATVEIKELARRYALTAVRELPRLATKAQSEQPRIAAIKEILDRCYGRPGETSEEPKLPQQEGMFIEPFRKPNGNGNGEPVKLEDWRNRP